MPISAVLIYVTLSTVKYVVENNNDIRRMQDATNYRVILF